MVYVEKMAHLIECRQYVERIVDKTKYNYYINRLQLCSYERGKWKKLLSNWVSGDTVFGTLHTSTQTPVHFALGIRKGSE